MPSSYTTSLRFELQFTGENVNLWGDKLNAALSRADDAVAGWLTKPLTGNYTLATANGAADEARRAMLKFTGTGAFTVTIPAVSKRYDVWNACTGDLTLTNGSASVVVKTGEVVGVVTDGGAAFKRVQPTDFGGARITSVGTPTSNTDAATKKYVDDAAFDSMSGTFPGQGGNAGKFLKTDGATPAWDQIDAADVQSFSASAAMVRTGTSTVSALTPGDTYNALAEVMLTDAATIAVDMATFINAAVTLGGNRTLGNPTNHKVGQSGYIRLIQDGTGSRTLTVGSNWKRPGGAASLTTTAGAVDILVYQVISSTYILYSVLQNPS